MSKLNKRAVAMFSLCLILFVTIMPFAVYANPLDDQYVWYGVDRNLLNTYSGSGVVRQYIVSNVKYYRNTIEYDLTKIYIYRIYSSGKQWYYLQFYLGSYVDTFYLAYNYTDNTFHIGDKNSSASILPANLYDNPYKVSFSGTLPYIEEFELRKLITGYTLTFDSDGGSSIDSITGIESGTRVHLGSNALEIYEDQYIPTKEGYDFIGWSLTPDGPNVYEVIVTEDTILYAKWSISYDYIILRYNDEYTGIHFYYDRSMTNEITFPLIQNVDDIFTFYVYSDSTKYFDEKISLHYLTGNFATIDYDERYYGTTSTLTHPFSYKFSIDLEYIRDKYHYQYVDLRPVMLDTYQCNCAVHISGLDSSQYVQNPFIKVWYPNGYNYQISPYDFTTYNSFLVPDGGYFIFNLDVIPPYILTSGKFTEGPVVGDREDDIEFYSDIESVNTNDYHYVSHVKAKCYPKYDGTMIISADSMTDYDYKYDRDPVVVYDESGNASWAFSEVELLDTDWSQVNDLIPTDLFGIFDGIYALPGLSLLVPLVMMVSFAIWFVRRS